MKTKVFLQFKSILGHEDCTNLVFKCFDYEKNRVIGINWHSFVDDITLAYADISIETLCQEDFLQVATSYNRNTSWEEDITEEEFNNLLKRAKWFINKQLEV
jgi:hypothetical protein